MPKLLDDTSPLRAGRPKHLRGPDADRPELKTGTFPNVSDENQAVQKKKVQRMATIPVALPKPEVMLVLL